MISQKPLQLGSPNLTDWHLFSDSPDRSTVQHLAWTGTYSVPAPLVCLLAPGHLIDTSAVSVRRLGHIYLLWLSRQCGWYLDAANQGISNGHKYTAKPSNLFGINFLFIMCIGIIRNNSLVGGRARADSDHGHWAHNALLHMAAKCVNHLATRAGLCLTVFLDKFSEVYQVFLCLIYFLSSSIIEWPRRSSPN